MTVSLRVLAGPQRVENSPSTTTNPPRLHFKRVVPISPPPPKPLPGTGQQVSRQKQWTPTLALAHVNPLVGAQALQFLRVGADDDMAESDGGEGPSAMGPLALDGDFEHAIYPPHARTQWDQQQAQRQADEGVGQGPDQAGPALQARDSWRLQLAQPKRRMGSHDTM